MSGSIKNAPPIGHEFIYALFDHRDEQGLRYIGRTKSATRQRLGEHIAWSVKDPLHPLSVWINEIMDQGFTPSVKILETPTLENVSKRETGWIKLYRPKGKLCNKSDGVGSLGMKRKLTVEQQEKLRQATIARNKMGWTPKMREKIMNRILKTTAKPVICVDTGQRFDSINDAARFLGTTTWSVKSSIRRGHGCCGLKFKLEEMEAVYVN